MRKSRVQELQALNALANAELAMGDLLVWMEREQDSVAMLTAANAAGIHVSKVRQRANVARRFPSGHFARAADVSFSVLRALTSYADDEVKYWLDRVKQEHLSVAQLCSLLAAERGDAPQCVSCEREVTDDETAVFIRIGQRRGYCCNVGCAANYFQQLVQSPRR